MGYARESQQIRGSFFAFPLSSLPVLPGERLSWFPSLPRLTLFKRTRAFSDLIRNIPSHSTHMQDIEFAAGNLSGELCVFRGLSGYPWAKATGLGTV